MPLASECCKGSKILVNLFLEWYTSFTTHNGILKNCTAAIIAIKAFMTVWKSWTIINSLEGCTMIPFASECCKGSKLLVELFLESYISCVTHNGILKNCTVAIIGIKAFLSVEQSWTIFNSLEGCTMLPLATRCF